MVLAVEKCSWAAPAPPDHPACPVGGQLARSSPWEGALTLTADPQSPPLPRPQHPGSAPHVPGRSQASCPRGSSAPSLDTNFVTSLPLPARHTQSLDFPKHGLPGQPPGASPRGSHCGQHPAASPPPGGLSGERRPRPSPRAMRPRAGPAPGGRRGLFPSQSGDHGAGRSKRGGTFGQTRAAGTQRPERDGDTATRGGAEAKVPPGARRARSRGARHSARARPPLPVRAGEQERRLSPQPHAFPHAPPRLSSPRP